MASDNSKIFAFVPQEHQIRMCSDERDKASSTRVCFCLKSFSPVWLTVHSYPVKAVTKNASFQHHSSERRFLRTLALPLRVDGQKYDDVIYHMLLALRMLCKGCFRILVSLYLKAHRMPYIYRFNVFVWTRGYSLQWPVYCNLQLFGKRLLYHRT